ncbi:MAG: hypothetical protein ACRDJS_07810 [Actinomycetota bacterium]
MRRTVLVALVISLIAGPLLAPAEARRRRRIVQRAHAVYQTPALGHSDALVGCLLIADGLGCVNFIPRAGMKFLKLQIKDQSGTSTYAAVSQDLDGDGIGDVDHPNVCGKTAKPIKIRPGYAVTVFINGGPGSDPPCPGIGTSGTVHATFSNLR